MNFKKLSIYSKDIEAQARFYRDLLGLEIVDRSETRLEVQMGNTLLALIQDKGQYQPYHFAINIPGYQEQEALAWLKELGVEILPTDDGEIKDFSAWNARSIYFYDPDGNIVELIARRNLKYDKGAVFTSTSLKEVSEIGVGAKDLPQLCQWLEEEVGVGIFSGAPVKFCAMGGERALFICVDSQEKFWYPTQVPAGPASFSVEMLLQEKAYRLKYTEEGLYHVEEEI